MKIKRLLTENQLSILFQIATILNILQLLITMICFHFFPENNNLNFVLTIFDHISSFTIATILTSQALLIFTYRHQIMLNRYKLFGVTIMISMAIFFVWLIDIENDIQQQFVEFISNTSKTDHSFKITIGIISLFFLLIVDFYRTLKNPDHINEESVPNMLRKVVRLTLRKYALIFIIFFGIVHIKKLHNFSVAILNYSRSSIEYNLSWLETLIPLGWIIALIVCLSYKFFKHKNLEIHIKD